MSEEGVDGGWGGSEKEKWKRPSTFRTHFPSVLLCLDNYIDDNKHARIVILWAPTTTPFFSFSSVFSIPALSSFLSPTIIQQFTYSACIFPASRFIFLQKWNQHFFSDHSRIHGTVEKLKTSEEKIPRHFFIPPSTFFSKYSRFILGTFVLTFNHHFTGPRYFPIKTTYNLRGCTFSRKMTMKIVVFSGCEVL